MSRGGRAVERTYRVLLSAYPAEFRREYGAEAARLFVRLHAEAAAAGAWTLVALWCRTVSQVLVGGLRERLRGPAGGRAGGPGAPRRNRLPDALWQDARLALRSVRGRPGFALTAIALIALGVGATTLIFSVVDGVLLKPLPYPESERLYRLVKEQSSLPIPDYVDVSRTVQSFDALSATIPESFDLTGAGEPERLTGARVAGDLLGLLGARAYRGRLFTEEELGAGGARVAVISAGFWVRRFGGDPSVIGRTLTLSGAPVEVIGILDPGFVPPLGVEDTDVYVPLDVARDEPRSRNALVLRVVARLRRGRHAEAAQGELNTLSTRLAAQYPDSWRDGNGEPMAFQLQALKERTIGDVGRTLWMFLGAVGLMLLIACANVANLFLARATEREQEMAVRSALGASRGRILAQVLTEGVLLALLGGAAGVGLAYAGVRMFRLLDPGGIPRFAEIGVDGRILMFALVVSAATGLLFAMVPAWSAARANAGSALRETGVRATASRGRARLRNGLVVGELALALILLAGAGVLFQSFVRLRGIDPGFDPDHLLTMQLTVSSAVPAERRMAFVNELLEHVEREPGVRVAALSWRLPIDRGRCCWNMRVTDATGSADTLNAMIHPVTNDYFAALGARVAEGRPIDAADQAISPIPSGRTSVDAPWPAWVPVVVNRVVAERLWPGQPAVGRVLRVAREDSELRVIGVVEPVRHWALSVEPAADVYIPFAAVAAWPLGLLDIGIRHDGPSGPVASALRATLRELAPDLPIDRIVTMEDRISGSVATPRFYAALLATFALLAFLLAAAGVYGSMLYMVGMRRREMGIRLALGAQAAAVAWLVLRRGALLVLVGTTFGLAGAAATTRVLRSLTFEVSVTDPRTITLAAVLLAFTALLACWLPARKAAKVDPVAMLRSE